MDADVSPALALSFVNTAEWHAGPEPEERLTSYDEALTWAERENVLDRVQAGRLLARAREHPSEAGQALQRIVALREALFRTFAAVAGCRPPVAADMQALNAELQEGATHLRLLAEARGCLKPGTGVAVSRAKAFAAAADVARPAESAAAGSAESDGAERFVWEWTGLEEHLTGFLWPVARSAAQLLTSPLLPRLRLCADERCGWVFIDQSKNASRRWCDMGDCGNRAKARRFRERRKTEPAV
jgi:predicted RNA-binding Zn ribbon-like protein